MYSSKYDRAAVCRGLSPPMWMVSSRDEILSCLSISASLASDTPRTAAASSSNALNSMSSRLISAFPGPCTFSRTACPSSHASRACEGSAEAVAAGLEAQLGPQVRQQFQEQFPVRLVPDLDQFHASVDQLVHASRQGLFQRPQLQLVQSSAHSMPPDFSDSIRSPGPGHACPPSRTTLPCRRRRVR